MFDKIVEKLFNPNQNKIVFMKKILLLLFIAFISKSAIADETPTFNWGSFIKTNGSTTTSPSSIKSNKQNEIFAFGTFASHNTKGQKASYKLVPYNENETPELFTSLGANYTGTGSNNNIFLYKLGNNGKTEWQVTSNMGDVNTNNSSATPTNDGGVFLALKVRHTNKNENNNNILLGVVDSEGTQHNVTWEYPGFWAYQGVFVKISATGKVEWTKLIPVATSIMDYYNTTKTETVDAFAFNDLATDEGGNIYLAGSYVNKITFGTKTLIPHNGENWGGDTQYAQNDLFLVKLNSAGEYIWDLVSNGQIKNETANSISYDNGYIYMLGNLSGDDTKTMQLGSYSATPTAKTDAYTAKIKTEDATVEWFNHFISLPINNVGGRIKIVSTQYDNGYVLTTGSFTGIIADKNKQTITENTNATKTFLQGFIIKQNALNGDVEATAIAPAGGISEFSTGFYRDNTIGVVGYLSSQYYISYDLDLTNPSETFDLVTGANSFDACVIDDNLLAFGRGRGTLGFSGTSVTESASAFSSILSSYTLPASKTGTIQEQEKNIIVNTVNGKINASFEGQNNLTLYSIDGRLIDNTIAYDNYSKEVQKGIYILSIDNKTFKVAVK